MEIKGVAHIHSTFSHDGKYTLEEIKKIFTDLGFSFVFISEHADDFNELKLRDLIQECSRLSDSSFVMIPGLEIPYQGLHILAFGIKGYQNLDFSSSENLLKDIKEQGGILFLAHPFRDSERANDFIKNIIHGIEVWNSHYDGKRFPRPQSINLAKELNVLSIAGLDFHKKHHLGGPAILLNSEIDINSIIESIREGSYLISNNGIKVDSRGLVNKNIVIGSFIDISVLKILKTIGRILRGLGINIGPSLKSLIKSRI